MTKWAPVKSNEIVETQVYGSHGWGTFKSRFLPWSFCRKCGFIALNNWVSIKISKGRCPWK